MANENFNRQMVVGMGTSLTSALVSAIVVFFILVIRKRLADKQRMLRNIQRARQPLPRSRSHSAQSVLSAAGYSAGFRGAVGGSNNIDDVQDGRQIRKITAYNERSFHAEGAPSNTIIDPMDHVLPSVRSRPLHPVHDPFYGRSRGQDRTNQDSMSSAPPSEGHPAVAAFRSPRLPATPTTFYTYDGRIANTLHSDEPASSSYDRQSLDQSNISFGHGSSQQGRDREIHTGRDGRNYYYGRQYSNQSLDSGLKELGGASTSKSSLYATPKKYQRNTRKGSRDNDDDWSSPWTSTPIHNNNSKVLSSKYTSSRKTSLPRTDESSLRRSSDGATTLTWAGIEPQWRMENSVPQIYSSGKRRSGSYDELENRRSRRRYESTGEVDDGLAVFDWIPTKGPVITLDHNPSSTFDGDVQLEAATGSDNSISESSNSDRDHDSALYSMEDLPKFTRSTAKLDLSNEEGGETNEALQLEEMYY